MYVLNSLSFSYSAQHIRASISFCLLLKANVVILLHRLLQINRKPFLLFIISDWFGGFKN